MKVKEIYPGLLLYTFPNQFELSHTFFRLQEFYESHIKKIRGKFFTYEDIITYYAYDQKKKPAFTYFEDWNGFNVPGNIVGDFEDLFYDDLTKKEIDMLIAINKRTLEDNNHYLIGVVEGEEETMKHEVAHGLYYLNKEYKDEMNYLIKQLPKKMVDRFKKQLKELGYCNKVMKDEIHAYLATGLGKGMVTPFNYLWNLALIDQFQITFDRYYEEIK